MKKTNIALLISLLTLSFASFAQTNNTATKDSAFNASTTLDSKAPFGYIPLNKPLEKFQKAIKSPDMLKKINAKIPTFKALEVFYLPDVQLYEISSEASNDLVYTNESISYFIINGQVVDSNKMTDITTERNKKFVANFVKENQDPNNIQLILGDPNAKNRRSIIIFSDPDCPFCKALDKSIHQDLKNQNITITYLMNPLHELPGHEKAPEKAAALWCAKDKNKAWENWMLTGEMPPNDGSCKNPTKEQAKFARRHMLLQTPTVFFDNGYFIKGQPETKEILQVLGTPGVRPD